MLSGVMEPCGLSKSLPMGAYDDSEYPQHVCTDRQAASPDGGIVAGTGVVGSGQTVRLARMPPPLREEGQREVCEALGVAGPRGTLHPLTGALDYALAPEKEGDITGQPAKSARARRRVRQRCQTPSGRLRDDAHEVPGQPRRGLQPRLAQTGRRGSRLPVVLAGHPRRKNARRQLAPAAPGARTTVLAFEGLPGQQRRSSTWLRAPGAPTRAPLERLPAAARDRLAARLSTPLQIAPALPRVLEPASRVGEKPVPPASVAPTLAPARPALEPPLTRDGDNVKALLEFLGLRQPEVRAFLRGQLPPGRTAE